MATRFPNAVIVDRKAEHRIVVAVDHMRDMARYVCSCGIQFDLPLVDIDLLKRCILETPSAQVLAWLEYPRE